MAEAIIGVVLRKLSSLIQKEVDMFLGVDGQLKSLSSFLTTITATLEDSEEKQFTDRAIKNLLFKLKDSAYVLDDILDECATYALEMEHGGFNCGRLNPKDVAFRYTIAKKFRKIRKRLNEIAEERSKFHLTEIVREGRSRVLDWRQTTSIITQPQVFGRNKDKDEIVDFLVDDVYGLEDLSVYPIGFFG